MDSNPGASMVGSRRAQVLPAMAMAVLLAAAALSVPAPPAEATVPRAVVDNALKATVYLEVERVYHHHRLGNTGSGFFVDDQGHLITNWHVVADVVEMDIGGVTQDVDLTVMEIRVVVNPRTRQEAVVPAKVVALDRERDLALLESTYHSPHFIRPTGIREVSIMDEVVVVGYPFGNLLTLDESGYASREGYPEASASAGRVTSIRRDTSERPVALQTDAAINPGNSGGPMIDAGGHLVGVVYADITGTTQIGFAIAPHRVWQFYQEQTVQVRFMPPYVTGDRDPIRVDVRRGPIDIGAAGGRVQLTGRGAGAASAELVVTDDGWSAEVAAPLPASGSTPPGSYVATIVMEDERGRQVMERRFRLGYKPDRVAADSSPRQAFTAMAGRQSLSNELSIHEYARRKALENYVDAAEPVKPEAVAPSQPLSPPSTAEPPAPPPTEEPPEVEEMPDDVEPVADPAALRAEGKEHYRAGRYAEAVRALERVVAEDPDDQISREYLELARERLELDGLSAPEALDVEAVAAPEPEPEPADPVITLAFESPLRSGEVRLWVDGEPLEVLEFKFKKKLLDLDGGGSGRVEHTFTVSPGPHTVQVELVSDRRGSFGLRTLEETFDPDSQWSLRIDLPSPDADPSIFLVESR